MAAWDTVYSKLLALVPTLTGLSADATFDGDQITQGLTDFACIGSDGQGNAGDYSQDNTGPDAMIEETGSVLLRLVSQSGETDLAPLRTQLSAWETALTQALRADLTLGGALTEGSVVRVERVDRKQAQTKEGAVAEAVVSVGYFTRL